ncbi:glycoside hydrolase family 25 protein [Desulfitobacterium chlororespirans]|uniref:N-acetylmuramoyl-L-alanine amidase n=1 Tax=Desulfitobacterium chlororespirans DSM 11544 TaxID=1121395 RepID=A0A1M7UX05_9FIRM|nr:glycoside hydrolase family 25 protein [Desulfitobacterium chlororespirans]SHN87470.1 N-acetylmuramoyl-L-alanine amidase [Desulfitobacterium chlororespirans DSM 11544]
MNIVDISEWQVPSAINYDTFARQLSMAIVRVQYGAGYQDKYFKTHITELQKRGVPVAVYAWVRGKTIAEMEAEATAFYTRAKEFNPTFWWLDVEEQSMADMRAGVSAYQRKLRALGAGKVGAYIAHHLYNQFNINVAEFDAVWIPHYGHNDGTRNSKPSYPCDIHQYTDKGSLPGYNGSLDLNAIISDKDISFFTGGDEVLDNLVIYADGDTGAALVLSQRLGCPMVHKGSAGKYQAIKKHWVGVQGTNDSGNIYYAGTNRAETARKVLE